jgi:ABC-2 type transport system ATP-binding protein
MGKTIIISSHILHELAELCTTVGILEQGELIFHGPIHEIIRKVKTGTRVQVRVTEQQDLAALVLQRARGVKSVDMLDGHLVLELESQTPDFTEIARVLLSNNFKIHEIKEEEVNLETAFMRLTKGIVQ